MKRSMLIGLLVLLIAIPAFAHGTSLTTPGSHSAYPSSLGYGTMTADTGEPEVIVTGAAMFLVAAMYYQENPFGGMFDVDRTPLDLVYNCITFLLGGTAGRVACIGNFAPYVSGLQTQNNYPYDINFMLNLEDNLNGRNSNLPPDHPYNCNFEFVQITRDTPLVSGGVINYDLLMIGEQWSVGRLHTRAEFIDYINRGGKVIVGGSSALNPIGETLTFLPKLNIKMRPHYIEYFPLPATDPGHPIARNIDTSEWGINDEILAILTDFDDDPGEQYYTKIFSNEGGPDGPTTVVLGGTNWGITKDSWGAIKAGMGQ